MTKRITTITELEEMVWDLVALSHTVGRMETDAVASQSKYDKLVDKRDDLRNKISMLFNSYKTAAVYPAELGWGKGKDE
jgi:hypothetical protein